MKLLRLVKSVMGRWGVPAPKMLCGAPVLTHVDLFRSKQTEPHVLRWMADALRPGDVCFDVGAHHGWMSMLAARKVGKRGKVFAFEPTPILVKYLNYIKRVNHLAQLEIVPKAVSDSDQRDRPFRIVGTGNSFMNSLQELQIPEDSSRGITIVDMETVSLDTFCQQAGIFPTLIKIDTEGAELLVCNGAKHVISSCKPVLIIAIHPTWLPKGQSIDDMFRFLEGVGYKVADSVLCEYDGLPFGDYLLLADRTPTK